jgi:RNA polymerase sigma-70 factor (ECF subfamily)
VETGTDEELLLSYARRQDEAAIGELVKRRWPEAYRIALRLLGDPGAAEDAAQEALMDLLRAAASFEEGKRFGPWFGTLVLNAARMSRRARGRRVRHEEAAARGRPRATAEGGDHGVLASELSRALETLPFDARAAVVLHHLEGRSLEEVAQATASKKSTVQSRVERGLGLLREALSATGGAFSVAQVVRALDAERGRSAQVDTPAAPSVAALRERARARSPRAARGLAVAGSVAVAVALAAGTVAALLPSSPGGPAGGGTVGSGTPVAGKSEPAKTGETPSAGSSTPIDASTASPASATSATPPSAPKHGSKEPAEHAASARTRIELGGRLVAKRPLEAASVFITNAAARRDPSNVYRVTPSEVSLPSAVTSGASVVARVEADGSFKTDIFSAPDEFHLVARALGYGVLRTELSVAAVATASFEDLVLGAGATVTGRLLGPGGAPIRAALVTLADEQGEIGALALSDPEGRFQIEGVRAGEWTLALAGQGMLQARRFLDAALRYTKKGVRPTTLVPGTGTVDLGDVSLEVPVIRGRVFGADGRPVAGALVQGAPGRQTGEAPISCRANEKGEFALALATPFDFPMSEVWLTSRSGDAVARAVTRSVKAGADPEPVDLTLVPCGSVGGRVDASPEDRSLMKVRARSEDVDARVLADVLGEPSAAVAADGSYRIAGLLPGRHTVEVLVGGKVRQSQAVDVVAGSDATASFTFGSTGKVHVRMTNAPPGGGGYEVWVVPMRVTDLFGLTKREQGDRPAEKRLDASAREALLDAIPAGTVSVLGRLGEALLIFQEDVVVKASETAEVTLTWPEMSELVPVHGKIEGADPEQFEPMVLVLGEHLMQGAKRTGATVETQLPKGDYRMFLVPRGGAPDLGRGTKVSVGAGKSVDVVLNGE